MTSHTPSAPASKGTGTVSTFMIGIKLVFGHTQTQAMSTQFVRLFLNFINEKFDKLRKTVTYERESLIIDRQSLDR